MESATPIIIFMVIIAGYALIMLRRNDEVYEERRKIINMIIVSGDYQEKLDYYRSISYGEMVWKFWKPVASFYDYEKFKKND